MNLDAIGKAAMADLLAGNSEAFDEKLKQFDPHMVEELYKRAADMGRMAFRNRSFKEAIDHFSGALAFAPDSAAKSRLFANRAACCMRLSRYEDALEEAKKAIALDPDWDKAWYRAGCALQELHQYENAIAVLRKVMKLRQQTGGIEFDHFENVKETDAESREIVSRYRQLSQSYNQMRMRDRYQVDYSRFDKLAQNIVSEEARSAAAAAQQEPLIQFSEDLSEDQRAALMAQLTGVYDEDYTAKQAKKAHDLRVVLDLGPSSAQGVPLEHRQAMARLLQVQQEAQLGRRILDLWDAGISQAWATKLFESMRDAKSVIFFGYESLYPLAYLWQKAPKPKPELHVIRRALSGAALELLRGMLKSEESADLLKIHFHLEEGDTQTSPKTVERSADPEEAQLQREGESAIEALKEAMPTDADLLVIDPEGLDSYLMGPRNPILHLQRHSLSFARMFPSRFEVWVHPCAVDVPRLWDTYSMRAAMQWSLLPQRVTDRCHRFLRRLGTGRLLWTLDRELSLPPSKVELQFDTLEEYPRALLFEVSAYDGNGDLIRRRRGGSVGLSMGSLPPALWWLSAEKSGQKMTAAFPNPLMTFELSNGVLTRVEVSSEGQRLLRTDPIVVNCADRFNWSASLANPEVLDVWEAACRGCRERVESDWRRRLQGTDFGWRDTVQAKKPKDQSPPPHFLLLDCGSVETAFRSLKALLRHRPALVGIAGAVTETTLMVTDGSMGTIRTLRGILNDHDTLQALREECWEKAPAILEAEVWRGADGQPLKPKRDTAGENSELRDWLFSRSAEMRPRLEVQGGTIRTIRPGHYDADVRMALSQLYGVSPDTPGLDSTAGCVVADRPFSGIFLGNPLSYPADVLSHGLIPTVLYARRALMTKYAHICPGRVLLMAQLVEFAPQVDGVEVSPLLALRNSLRPEYGSPPPVPDASRFHFGYRSEITWAQMEENGLARLVGHPMTLLDLDLNEHEESRLVRQVIRDRTIETEATEVCDGLLIWAEWFLDKERVVGNPPTPSETITQLPTRQQMQLLPRRAAGRLKYCGIPSMTDFIVTWGEESAELDERALVTVETSTSVPLGLINRQQDRLAMTIGQQLSSSPAAAKEIGLGVIGLSRMEGTGIEPEILNNVLYAAMS